MYILCIYILAPLPVTVKNIAAAPGRKSGTAAASLQPQ